MGQALGDPALAGEKEGLRSNGKKKRYFFVRSIERPLLTLMKNGSRRRFLLPVEFASFAPPSR